MLPLRKRRQIRENVNLHTCCLDEGRAGGSGASRSHKQSVKQQSVSAGYRRQGAAGLLILRQFSCITATLSPSYPAAAAFCVWKRRIGICFGGDTEAATGRLASSIREASMRPAAGATQRLGTKYRCCSCSFARHIPLSSAALCTVCFDPQSLESRKENTFMAKYEHRQIMGTMRTDDCNAMRCEAAECGGSSSRQLSATREPVKLLRNPLTCILKSCRRRRL